MKKDFQAKKGRNRTNCSDSGAIALHNKIVSLKDLWVNYTKKMKPQKRRFLDKLKVSIKSGS